jgi:hypothetical protein
MDLTRMKLKVSECHEKGLTSARNEADVIE